MRNFAPRLSTSRSTSGPPGCGLPRRAWLMAALGGALQGLAPTVRAAAPAQPMLPPLVRTRLTASGLPLNSFGLFASPVEGGPAVLSANPDAPYVLASTAKLVTAMAALDLLGPRYRWRTRAYALGEIVKGRLLGDLLIVGGGDAGLRSDDLRQWFVQMREEGLQEVTGNILLDRHAFLLHEQDHAGTPEPAADRPHHTRPDALMLDGGQPRAAPKPDKRNSAAALPKGRKPPSPAEDPALQVMAALWRQTGGVLGGRVLDRGGLNSDSPWPRGADGRMLPVFSAHGSPPLADLIHAMNKSSDNVAARHLMLSLAPGFPRYPATLPAAKARLHDWLRTQGLGPGDIVLDNGSGLSRAERGKPSAMVALLRKAWRHPNAQDFITSLPVAGVDGTLAHRLTRPTVQGQAFLKTGTLLDARALAGYVHGRSGRWYAVAALANHPSAASAVPVLDGVIEWLAGC